MVTASEKKIRYFFLAKLTNPKCPWFEFIVSISFVGENLN